MLLIDDSAEWRRRESTMALNTASSQPTDLRPRQKAPALNRCSSQPIERRPRGKATTPKTSSLLPDAYFVDRGWFKLYIFNLKVLKWHCASSFLGTVIEANC